MNPHTLAMHEKSLATTADLYVYSHLLIPWGLYSLVVGCSPADSHYLSLSSGCSLADGHYSHCVAAHLLKVTTLSCRVAAHLLMVNTLSYRAAAHLMTVTTLVVWLLTCWWSLLSLAMWLLTHWWSLFSRCVVTHLLYGHYSLSLVHCTSITHSSVLLEQRQYSVIDKVSCHFSSIKSLLFSQLIACSY